MLTSRALRVRRFEQLTVLHFSPLLAVAFIAGLVWWQRGRENTVKAAQDTIGLLFFVVRFGLHLHTGTSSQVGL